MNQDPTRPDTEVVISRHLVENALTQYCSAMDGKDAAAAAIQLANADLYFKDHTPHRGHDDIDAFYTSVFAASTDTTAHLISNLKIDVDDATIFYSCVYQRFSTADTSDPRLTGIGRYSGRFARIRLGVCWLEHHVTTL